LLLHARVLRLAPIRDHRYFLIFLNYLFIPIGAMSSNPTGAPPKNSPLSTAFNSHPTYPRESLWGCWIPLEGWGVAESGGNRVKIENKLLLFSKKFQNFDLFKNPSFKVDNILRAYYHHVWWYVEPIRLLPEFHSGIQRNKCSVGRTDGRTDVWTERRGSWNIILDTRYPLLPPWRY